jgi:hypothetical protein
MFANEDIKLQNFWASSKSHVATTYLSMHLCSNYIGWSNQGKYYKIEAPFAKQDVIVISKRVLSLTHTLILECMYNILHARLVYKYTTL